MLQTPIGLPANKACYNCLVLVQLIGGMFARMRAARGANLPPAVPGTMDHMGAMLKRVLWPAS